MRKIKISLLIVTIFFVAISCSTETSIDQISINRVETMPYFSEPCNMPDCKIVAVNFDQYVINHDLRCSYLSIYWLDDSGRNFSQETFGLYTAISEIRQGSDVHNGEYHEAINSLGAFWNLPNLRLINY
jgi:hypothetical protein